MEISIIHAEQAFKNHALFSILFTSLNFEEFLKIIGTLDQSHPSILETCLGEREVESRIIALNPDLFCIMPNVFVCKETFHFSMHEA